MIIVTGEEGLQHGYADRYRPDGVFEYFGEGQVGDMQLHKGNRAIAEHSAEGKSLLLFGEFRQDFASRARWSTRRTVFNARPIELALIAKRSYLRASRARSGSRNR